VDAEREAWQTMLYKASLLASLCDLILKTEQIILSQMQNLGKMPRIVEFQLYMDFKQAKFFRPVPALR